jgi:hypothetical protein
MPEEQKKAAKTKTYVTFPQRPTLRMITEEDWAAAGVKDHPRTIWGPENDWTVAKEHLGLNDEQYARIIKADRMFTEVERVVEGD